MTTKPITVVAHYSGKIFKVTCIELRYFFTQKWGYWHPSFFVKIWTSFCCHVHQLVMKLNSIQQSAKKLEENKEVYSDLLCIRFFKDHIKRDFWSGLFRVRQMTASRNYFEPDDCILFYTQFMKLENQLNYDNSATVVARAGDWK